MRVVLSDRRCEHECLCYCSMWMHEQGGGVLQEAPLIQLKVYPFPAELDAT
jgi:hypothetical protein